MTGTDLYVNKPHCTAAAQCGLFTHKSVPVIFEPPCTTTKNTWHYYRPGGRCSNPLSLDSKGASSTPVWDIGNTS